MNKVTESSGGELCGIGMSVVDRILVIDDFPSDGGITEAREHAIMGGGPVPTALCAAARLGTPSAIVDRVGDDWWGKLVDSEYRRHGVDTSELHLAPRRTTAQATVLVRSGDGQRHVISCPGDAPGLGVDELPSDRLRRAGCLHLNGRHWPACLAAAGLVRDAGGWVSFDGGAHRFQPRFRELLEKTHLAIVARDFAERLSGSTRIEDQLEAIRNLGPVLAGITDGADGSWFSFAAEAPFHQPAFAVKVVDTTGCGDVFHGAFLHRWLAGEAPAPAARFASAAAAIAATGLGGRGRLPVAEEVEALLRKSTTPSCHG